MSDLKRLPHRAWTSLRDLWLAHIPDINFGAQFPAPTLWDIPGTEKIERPKAPVGEIPYIEGVRESVFREAVVLSRKFTYCRKVAASSAQHGRPTWALIAAYDASFFAAKALCYLLGFVSSARSSPLYLDIFAPRLEKRRKESVVHYDVICVHPLKERLSHDVLWGITGRLIRTTTFPETHAELLQRLRALKFDGVSTLRNSIIYSGGFWTERADLTKCDLIQDVSPGQILGAGALNGESGEEQNRYFVMVELLGETLAFFLSDIAHLRPAIGSEVQALSQWQT